MGPDFHSEDETRRFDSQFDTTALSNRPRGP